MCRWGGEREGDGEMNRDKREGGIDVFLFELDFISIIEKVPR